MKTLKPLTKKSGKSDRERKVLLGLIDYYIKTGKPVGSNTLKEVGFADLSSATIRNYFAHLEEQGYLTQQHSSGGRLPTEAAFRFYAAEYYEQPTEPLPHKEYFDSLQKKDTREIASLMQQAAEQLAAATHNAVFLSAPRFEQDFIVGIKLVAIDTSRCLCILITDFGDIRSEILHIENKLSAFSAKRIESYFNWRLSGQQKPEGLNKEEEDLAQKLYNEVLLRYIVSYSQFNEEDVYRTGLSFLPVHSEFQDPTLLASSLALFENTHGMRLLLRDCSKHNALKFWIGSDLTAYSPQSSPHCTVIAIPYYVNTQPVGAIGLLGPMRMPYRSLFATLHQFSEQISETLTRNLYKFKITLRQPKTSTIDLKQDRLIGEIQHPLLEDKSTPEKHSARRK